MTNMAQFLKPNLFRQKFALVILTLSSILPAFAITGFLPETQDVSKTLMSIIAVVGGALAVSLYHPNKKFWAPGLLSGAIINLGIFWASVLYTHFRDHIIIMELFIPILIGAIPGILILKFTLKSN